MNEKSKACPLAISKIKKAAAVLLPALLLFAASHTASAQKEQAKVEVPDWALPGSATHTQVSPPDDFHRATKTKKKRIGIFDGVSEVGSALVPGSSSYNKKTGEYTISASGYNVWYNRDEFRFLWKKMSGDVSMAADVSFPDPKGYFDRKVILIVRQSLDDDAKEIMVGLHGGGLLHLAWRAEKGAQMKDRKVDKNGGLPNGETIEGLPKRVGIEKKGDQYALYVSMKGEPMHQVGEPFDLKMDAPFYVGIGFSSHIPDVVDTGVVSNVVLENAAGKVQ